MKIILAVFFALFLSTTSFAQCSSCTITVSTTDGTNHQIGIGQVLCVTPTGTLTGSIYVGPGGKLCNQGHINANIIGVAGGGQFDNYNIAHMDTLYIGGASAILNNYDTMAMNIFYCGESAVLTNNGELTCNIYGDTATTFINNGSFSTHANMYVGNTSTFYNYRHLNVGGNFYCGTTGNFTTSCMVNVLGDWYNSGTISGPVTGCGGFTISGQSFNSGTVGAIGHIDLCDTSHPVNGIDGNSGTLTGVTFCQCTDTCTVAPSGIRKMNEREIAFSLFPNPASDRLQIKFDSEMEATITVMNTLGQIIQRSMTAKGAKEASLNTATLSTGLYIVTIESRGMRTSRKIEIIR
ncbi:MAG: hypothetical protein JWO03_887 [Bacteroidetes bacterium]|nr:hypothetical protein [Bacteroidota bacterium]